MPDRAHLVYAWPAPNAVIGSMPDQLELHFAVPLAADDSTAEVIDERGETIAGETHVLKHDARLLRLRLVDAANAPPGRYTVHWQSVSASTRDHVSDEFSFTVRPGLATQPQVLVSPRQSDAQQPVNIVGSGFSARTALTLAIGDDEEALGKADTDANGAFNVTLKVPPDVPFGQQPIWVRDAAGVAGASELELRWGGWPPLRVYTQADPGPEGGEVKFTVVGRNRSDYVLEDVRVHLQVPDGTSVVAADEGARPEPGGLVWDQGVVDRTTFTPRSAILRADGPVVGHAQVEFRHRRARGCVSDDCLPAFVDQTSSESGIVSPAT
jgi:methionine-rich copper-binding protein CopC